MSYRAPGHRVQTPTCEVCGQPAVIYDHLGAWYMCPARHVLDIDDPATYFGCYLAGSDALDPFPPDPEPTRAARFMAAAWRMLGL